MSFRVYDWKDRVHSSVNRISLVFKVFDHGAHCNGTAFLSVVLLIHYSETISSARSREGRTLYFLRAAAFT